MHALVTLFSALVQAAAPVLPVSAPDPVKEVVALAGFSGLLALLVNVAKNFGVIKDGNAGFVSAILNLLLTAGLLTAQQYLPAFDLKGWDSTVASVAQAGTILFGLFLQFGSSFLTHQVASGMKLPVVGASHADGTVKASVPKG